MNNYSLLSERKIENLLHTLGADKKPYPRNLLEARRAAYLAQVTVLVGTGSRPNQGNEPSQGGISQAVAPMTPVMKAILTVLVAGNIALATYLGVLVYENWDKVQALLSDAPVVSETSPAPFEESAQPPVSDSAPEITTAPESTVVVDSTPAPDSPPEDTQAAGDNSGDSPEVSTPEPPAKDKPGLHLGQTPHAPDEPPSQDTDNDQGNDKNKDKDKNK